MHDHEHTFDGPMQISRLAGTPHYECTVIGCRVISLPDDDDEPIGWTEHAANS